ncbi:hypothetical protein Patl1_32296 [Pistacia atlantica]|uniref:Uncharacterized protein n=1 Tax=Pistacia atlantica TaxID=434234 RepID=A0ACC1ALZ2_9ROSI|nr:hypothetical protein Patl1_32296 [Pistacia atlantica]
MLSGNLDRACYGPKNLDVGHEFRAIKMLLISEDLVKSAEIERRWKYVELVKSVKSVRGKALVYLSKHVFGEQSATLTGIATRPSNIRPVPMGKQVPAPNGQVQVLGLCKSGYPIRIGHFLIRSEFSDQAIC